MEAAPAERETPADWGDGAVALSFRVKTSSRESGSQKASNVLEPDLRSHWSTGTNTKEWILLEIQEPCLLSHIRIYNKSVLEWELTAGLRYKPDAFVKVRPRCEAPKRDMVYPGNHIPCRYVRISCLRGNPIAIFFIQLIGIPVPGLEPEFQPLVNYLLPQITSSKHPPSQNLHLQLLKDIASRLSPFLPQIEADINSLAENPESSVRFLALLAGPLYPIIYLVNERDPSKTSISSADSDRTNPAVTPTVSSNFEAQPRRLRSPSSVRPAAHLLAFQFETSVLLLRKALRDKTLGVVCLRASNVLQKLLQPEPLINKSIGGMLLNHNDDEIARCDSPSLILSTDYSSLFGEEFSISEIQFDGSFLNILDVAAVEEGILHVLYAAASQPMLCCKLAEITSDLWSVLPLVQALLPALRPPLSSGPIEQIDDSFNQWNHPTVHNALSQIVTMSVSSSVFHPLLRACAGYLSSYLSSHAKAACVLLDLCKGPLITWIPMIVAKIDFAVELVEDLLYVIQEAGRSLARSRAALKYFVLAISGHMDDVLTEYKEVMHKLLFILEMLDPFINPSTCVMKDTIRFGGISAIYMEKQTCAFEVALTIIRTAVKRAAVLPSLELEWRRGAVAPSVILSILDPHMPLPPDIDLCKSTVHENDHVSLAVLDYPAPQSSNPENIDGHDTSETIIRAESFEQCSSLFAPEELKQCELTRTALSENGHDGTTQTSSNQEIPESRLSNEKLSSNPFQLDNITAADYFDAQADYQQLINHQDCELRAHEFQRLALNLCMQQEPTLEGHNAGIDALLLAAECYVNPFFLLDCQLNLEPLKKIEHIHSELMQGNVSFQPKDLHLKDLDLVTIYNMENKRDKSVIDLLLQAARFDCEYHKKVPEGEPYPDTSEDDKQSIQISAEALQFADALTLVRKNQAMICHFIMKQFQRKEHSHSEILLQSLLFLLHSATDLFCRPEDIIDIILKSAENLNEQLLCLYSCINAGDRKLDRIKLHGLRRRWTLLQKLVLASSGSDNTRELVTIKRDGFRFRSLVPPSVWICKISDFFMFSCPLPRFLGWMAVSRYAKEYLNERLFLASDFSQLTSLLSIYMDELSLMDRAATQKARPVKHELSNCSKLFLLKKETALSVKPNMATQFKILFPELHFFFPSMCSLFNAFGESILEAVGLQLKCLTNSAVQDVLCWFSEMCLWPYLERIKGHLLSANRVSYLRGNVAANAKAVVFYLLESIVVEHVEAIIPEMPRIVHILVSLCRASYTDVAFLNSVLCLVKPLISYYLKNRADAGKALGHASECSDFELLCFEELFEITQCSKLSEGTSGDKIQRPLLIFILGSMFSDFSFERRNKILGSILGWVDYLSSDPPSLLCNYLQSFQMLIDGCETVLVQNIEFLGIRILSVRSHSIESTDPLVVNKNNTQLFKKARDIKEDVLAKFKKHIENGESHKIVYSLRPASIKDFCGTLEKFISHLTPSIEGSWKWHNQLASRLSLSIAKCLLFAKLLKSVLQEDIYSSSEQDIASKISSEVAQKHWESALEGLVEMIIVNQEKQCWQVASAMLDYIIKIQNILTWGNVLNSICSAVKHFCSHAPRISWRLQTEKWLPLLVSGGIEGFKNRETGLIDLFCIMLSHSEPEQRSFALQQLGRIINSASHTINDSKPPYDQNIIRSDSKVASLLATHTWDRVAALAIHDSSMLLRNHAMALLTEFVPFVDTKHLQSFLGSSNSILNSMGQLSGVIEEGYMTRMSLLLLSKACLYSAPEDIALIPECVWRKMESMQTSTGGFSYMEKDLCRALCQLRSESDAKTDVEEVISGCTRQPISSDFKSIRESILQVLSSLSSLDAYFEFFSVRYDQEYQELEEAEIELELIEKEKADHDFSGHPHDDLVPDMPPYNKDDKRLQEIRENIRSLERSRLKEEITARRQKKLLIRHAREKYLEETRSREMELMQELDRERALELEHEIERQRQLDIERAKSRELQFNLEMEKEKQTQRELQRELEQVELGRSSRREYSTNPNSRSRERYRERDGGRSQQEGSLRSSSRGHEGGGSSAQALAPAGSPGPTTVVLAGSRTFSGGNLLTILQPRERTADEDSAWAEGSRDSGDASSVGDPEFDGPRQHGPRASGSKSLSSRQLVERREREGAVRREGKWERKQHS